MANFANLRNNPPWLIHQTNSNFYARGWKLNCGGGMAIKEDGFISYLPSDQSSQYCGVDDIVQVPDDTTIIDACAGLLPLVFRTPGVSVIAHTHSIHSIKVGSKHMETNYVKLTNPIHLLPFQGPLSNLPKELMVPIVNDTYNNEAMQNLISERIETPLSAMFVRSHGLFVWGPTWDIVNTNVESIETLCALNL